MEEERQHTVMCENIKIKKKKNNMACTNVTLAGITLGCETSKGGIQTVYLVQASDVESVALDTENQMIETITLGASKT